MLKKANRLTTKEFDQVFNHNKPHHFRWFIFLESDDSRLETRLEEKYAVAASKKKWRRRVDRNHLRRIFYRAIKQLLDENPAATLTGGIVVVKKGTLMACKENKTEVMTAIYNDLATALKLSNDTS
jgi:ribonuclease P protein component